MYIVVLMTVITLPVIFSFNVILNLSVVAVCTVEVSGESAASAFSILLDRKEQTAFEM